MLAPQVHAARWQRRWSALPAWRCSAQVTAWFAPQFAELRRRCCAGGEEAFLCSLSRCRAWEARGGKTRAYFAKTADDRYIVKQLQASEKKSFQEIAPAYFKLFGAPACDATQPTCLAKIMGVLHGASPSCSNELLASNVMGEHCRSATTHCYICCQKCHRIVHAALRSPVVRPYYEVHLSDC